MPHAFVEVLQALGVQGAHPERGGLQPPMGPPGPQELRHALPLIGVRMDKKEFIVFSPEELVLVEPQKAVQFGA